MKKTGLLLFLIFSFNLFFAQTSEKTEYRGTIRIRKMKLNSTLPESVNKKKQGIRVFIRRFNGSDYKETFPASYQSSLFPLVFNGGGLILTDENKQWSTNTIIGYDYEIFIGNTAAFKVKSATTKDLNSNIRCLGRNEYMWITKLYYTDREGKIHANKIGDFKIEKIR